MLDNHTILVKIIIPLLVILTLVAGYKVWVCEQCSANYSHINTTDTAPAKTADCPNMQPQLSETLLNLNKCNSALNQSEQAAQTHETTTSEQQQQLTALQNRITTLETQNQELNTTNTELTKAARSREEALAVLVRLRNQDTIGKLTQQLKDITEVQKPDNLEQNIGDSLAELRQIKFSKLQQELKSKDLANQTLETELNQLKQERNALQTRLDNHNRNLGKVYTKLFGTSTELNPLRYRIINKDDACYVALPFDDLNLNQTNPNVKANPKANKKKLARLKQQNRIKAKFLNIDKNISENSLISAWLNNNDVNVNYKTKESGNSKRLEPYYRNGAKPKNCLKPNTDYLALFYVETSDNNFIEDIISGNDYTLLAFAPVELRL